MTKQEAIQAMKAGLSVTHQFFTPDEFISMPEDSTIETEEGYTVPLDEFFMFRPGPEWETGWRVYDPAANFEDVISQLPPDEELSPDALARTWEAINHSLNQNDSENEKLTQQGMGPDQSVSGSDLGQ